MEGRSYTIYPFFLPLGAAAEGSGFQRTGESRYNDRRGGEERKGEGGKEGGRKGGKMQCRPCRCACVGPAM